MANKMKEKTWRKFRRECKASKHRDGWKERMCFHPEAFDEFAGCMRSACPRLAENKKHKEPDLSHTQVDLQKRMKELRRKDEENQKGN